MCLQESCKYPQLTEYHDEITNSAYSAKCMVRVKCDVREGEMRGTVQGFCVRNG